MKLRAEGVEAHWDVDGGARLTSLRVGVWELMGAAAPTAGEPAGFFSGCFPLAPYAGMITGSILRDPDGTTRRLAQNTAHGSAHGVVWDVPWRIVHRSASTARLETVIDDRWPYRGVVALEVALRPHSLALELSLTADEAMPVSLGFHPWFPRRIGAGDAEISVEATRMRVLDEAGMASGETTPVDERPWDAVLTDVAGHPVIRWPELEVQLRAPTSTWVVFERLPEAFCVEPITAPAGDVAAGRPRVEAHSSVSLPFELHWRSPGRAVVTAP